MGYTSLKNDAGYSHLHTVPEDMLMQEIHSRLQGLTAEAGLEYCLPSSVGWFVHGQRLEYRNLF